MYVYTKFGLISIVKKRGNFIVRARLRDHIEKIVFCVCGLTPREVEEDTGIDYKFRTIVSADELIIIMTTLALSVDYSCLKRAVKDDDDYLSLLQDTWNAAIDAQEVSSERKSSKLLFSVNPIAIDEQISGDPTEVHKS